MAALLAGRRCGPSEHGWAPEDNAHRGSYNLTRDRVRVAHTWRSIASSHAVSSPASNASGDVWLLVPAMPGKLSDPPRRCSPGCVCGLTAQALR